MLPSPPSQFGPRSPRYLLPILFTLISLSLLLAWRGARHASPTYDEPLHLAASAIAARTFDLSINPEHPPLWKLAVGLAIPHSLAFNTATPAFAHLADDPRAEWEWSTRAIYRQPLADPTIVDDAFAAGRAVTLAWGAALLLLTAALAHRLAGPPAALIATALLAFDPTFLAHTVLITNDVPFAAATALFALTLLHHARKPSLPRAALIGLALGLAFLIKFSAIALIPIAAAYLLWSALPRGTGSLPARRVRPPQAAIAADSATTPTTGKKPLPLSLAHLAVLALTAYVTLWAGYGFRSQPLPLAPELADLTTLHAGQTTLPARTLAFAADHHFLPTPFVRGLLTQYRISHRSRAYLLGQNHNPVPLYALPLAYLLKTPTATLVALLLAAALPLLRRRPHLVTRPSSRRDPHPFPTTSPASIKRAPKNHSPHTRRPAAPREH